MNTGSLPFDLNRLCNAIRRGREMLEEPRKQRRAVIEQVAGDRYGNNLTYPRTPTNLCSLYLNTVKRNLISKDPRVLMTSDKRELAEMLVAMQQWENDAIVDMNLAQSLDECATDALTGYIGIVKIALMNPAESSSFGWSLAAGTPQVVTVDFEDYVIDPHASKREMASFEGHRYKVPFDTVKKSTYFKNAKKALRNIEAARMSLYNEQGDDKIGTIGTGETAVSDEPFEDWIYLWEIYLPRHKCIVTLYDHTGNGPEVAWNEEPLDIRDWVGPPCGPYHVLGFGRVSGNMLSKGPMLDLLSLDLAYNQLMTQLIEQGLRQKELFIGSTQSGDDMKKLAEARDGEGISVSNPDSVKAISLSGPSQVNQAFATQIYQIFNQLAGNLALLGGLSKQSNTATQDKMLNENASATIMDKQETMVRFTTEVAQALTWYWWYDPNKTYSTKFGIPGEEKYSVDLKVSPEDRIKYPYSGIKVRIDPYTLVHKTPQQRANDLLGLVTQVLLPMSQILQQQGIALDMTQFLEIMGEYKDMPELKRVLKWVEPPQTEPGERGQGPGETEDGLMSGPADYEKNYTRTSVSNGPSEEGMMRDRMNQMMNQRQEQAA